MIIDSESFYTLKKRASTTVTGSKIAALFGQSKYEPKNIDELVKFSCGEISYEPPKEYVVLPGRKFEDMTIGHFEKIIDDSQKWLGETSLIDSRIFDKNFKCTKTVLPYSKIDSITADSKIGIEMKFLSDLGIIRSKIGQNGVALALKKGHPTYYWQCVSYLAFQQSLVSVHFIATKRFFARPGQAVWGSDIAKDYFEIDCSEIGYTSSGDLGDILHIELLKTDDLVQEDIQKLFDMLDIFEKKVILMRKSQMNMV